MLSSFFKKSKKAKNRKKKARRNPDEGSASLGDSIKESISSTVDYHAMNILQSAAYTILPAVGGYATSHVLASIGSKFVKSPGFLGHVINPLLSAVSLALLYVGTGYVFTKFRDEIIIGSAINLIQSLVSSFMPGLSWLLGGAPTTIQLLPGGDAHQQQQFNSDGSLDVALLPSDGGAANTQGNDLSDFYTGPFSGGFGS
jgi:hypothetical protein